MATETVSIDEVLDGQVFLDIATRSRRCLTKATVTTRGLECGNNRRMGHVTRGCPRLTRQLFEVLFPGLWHRSSIFQPGFINLFHERRITTEQVRIFELFLHHVCHRFRLILQVLRTVWFPSPGVLTSDV